MKKEITSQRDADFIEKYSEDFYNIIQLISVGKSVRGACLESNVSYTAFYKLINLSAEHEAIYDEAKNKGLEVLADDILAIADERPGLLDDKKGFYEGQKLKIHARQWLLGKLKRKKYGEKLEVDHGNTDDKPFLTEVRRVIVNARDLQDNKDKPS